MVNGIATSTKTITETLTDGTDDHQKQVITETFNDVVDGALVTVERVKNIAADGIPNRWPRTIKKASADSFDWPCQGLAGRGRQGRAGHLRHVGTKP